AMLRKRLTLDERRPWLYLEYEIHSRSEKGLPYLFKFHPAIAIEPGDEFRMPPSVMEPVALGFSRLLGSERKCEWPAGLEASGRVVRIDRALENDGHAREFVRLSEFKRGDCAIHNQRTGSTLGLEFSPECLPY